MNKNIKILNPYVLFHNSDIQFPTHAHNEYELLFFLQGDVTYYVEDKIYDLHPYDLVIVKPIEYHAVMRNTQEDYARIDIFIPLQSKFTEKIQRLSEVIQVINCSANPIIVDCFKRFILYYEKYSLSPELEELTEALLTEILYNLQVNFDTQALSKAKPLPPILQEALAYINSNLFTITDIDEITDHLFVSKNYFFRAFKKQLNMSPKKYITSKRLLHAQVLLSQGKNPTKIYRDCGFPNYVSFYKNYLEYFKYPPSQEKVSNDTH